MEETGPILSKLAQALQGTRRDDQDELTQRVKGSGSAAEWLRSIGLGGHPADLTVTELVTETQAFWLDAAKRERSCQRCPEYGGECSGELSCWAPGTYLAWSARQPEKRQCQRWPEFTLRDRLRAAGVPFRLQGHRAETFRRTPENEQAYLEIGTLVKTCVKHHAIQTGMAWVLLSGDHGTGKTHLMIAALRTVRRERPQARVWYHGADALAREIQSYLDNRDSQVEPQQKLLDAELLCLDNVNFADWKPWFQKEVENLLRRRWDEGLATIVATNESPETIEKHLSSLTDLANGAVLCTLT